MEWEAIGFSEVEAFPSAVLAHHYPTIPNHGDMTQYEQWNIKPGTVDLLVGGTPCQSFSVAGLRKGLADPRGNLMLTFGAIAKHYQPRWLVWENVPGVLSSNRGRDFGTFLGMLAELGYGFAYRVLDAQYVRTCRHIGAVPQRRRRVFAVGCLGDWRRAAAVLFDRESVSGNPPPRREAGQRVAADAGSRAQSGSQIETYRWQNQDQGIITDDCAASLKAKGTTTDERSVGSYAVMATSQAGAEITEGHSPIAFERRFVRTTGGQPQSGVNGCLRADTNTGDGAPCVAFAENSRAELRYCGGDGKVSSQLTTGGGKPGQGSPCVAQSMSIRRLTPVECERLQGFPDNFTRIPWRNKPAEQCPDGPRYKALGNSMAVNCMEWIGRRIETVEQQ